MYRIGGGQDGELEMGTPCPQPGFTVKGDRVVDHLAEPAWVRKVDLTGMQEGY